VDVEAIFELNKAQFKLWCDFCLDNTIEMYENKDSYMNVWDREKEKYLVYVQRNEQTGIIKFLEKVLDTF
jgi:hypothetical protein